jgi:hypothetical protein
LHLFLLCGWLFRTPSLSAGWLSVKRVGGGFPFSAFLIILGFWFCNFANAEKDNLSAVLSVFSPQTHRGRRGHRHLPI